MFSDKLHNKIREVEGNRQSIHKLLSKTTDWNKYKKLLGKDHKLYEIWYKRTSKLSRLLKIKVGMRSS